MKSVPQQWWRREGGRSADRERSEQDGRPAKGGTLPLAQVLGPSFRGHVAPLRRRLFSERPVPQLLRLCAEQDPHALCTSPSIKAMISHLAEYSTSLDHDTDRFPCHPQ